MRVLHINSTIVVNSGVMSVIMNYYRNIDRTKVQFDFLYFNDNKFKYKTYEDEICSLGGRVYYIEQIKKIRKFNIKLNELLEKNTYDTVHLHDAFVLNFIYKTLRKNNIKNIIVHSHATQWSDKFLSGVRNKILCLNLKYLVDYPFACSIASGKFLYGRRKFFVMNNAISVERYAYDENIRKNIRRGLNIEHNTVFGFVGNICSQKNPEFLIDVFYKIVKKDNSAILIMVGDGVMREQIEKKIILYGLENRVMLLGKKNDVENYYQAFDCLLLPSLFEGLPMVGVEAQCSGLPVVFSDSITKEVAADKSIFLPLNSSLDDWAEKSLLVAKKNYNRSLAVDEMTIKGFNIKKEAQKIQDLYLNLGKVQNNVDK